MPEAGGRGEGGGGRRGHQHPSFPPRRLRPRCTTHSLTLSLSHSLTLSLSHSLTLSLFSLSHSLTLTLSRSLSHAHSLTLSLSHTLTPASACRFRAKRQHFARLPGRQDHNLASTVLYVPCSLDNGSGGSRGRWWRAPGSSTPSCPSSPSLSWVRDRNRDLDVRSTNFWTRPYKSRT